MHKTSKLFPYLKSTLSVFLFFSLLSIAASVSAAKFNTQKRYLYVQPGQSIFSIVKVLYPNQKDQWPVIIKKLVRKNPRAFIGADATKIQTGERLELPAYLSNSRPVSSTQAVVYKGPRSVGQVIQARGKTFSISQTDKKRNLEVGSEVFVGDRMFTGVKGFIRLSMIDEAKIDLRCNSEMLIEDYQLMRGGNRSVIYLIKGSMNKITGSIGKLADDLYELHTPVATVGVRGTEYALRVLQSYGCDGSLDVNSNGLFVKVKHGGIDLDSKTGKTGINEGEAALLATKDSQLINIEARDGVFYSSQADTQKGSLFGSFSWMLLLMPLIFVMRKIG